MKEFNKWLMGSVLLVGVAINASAHAGIKCNIKLVAKNSTDSIININASKSSANQNDTLNINKKSFRLVGMPIHFGGYSLESTSPRTQFELKVCNQDYSQCNNLNIAIDFRGPFQPIIIHPSDVVELNGKRYFIGTLQDCSELWINILES